MFVKSVIPERQAWDYLSKKKGLFKKRKLEKVELIYLPYYLYKVSVWVGEDREVSLGVDGIEGTFLFFDLNRLEITEGREGVTFDFFLSPEEAESRALEEYRWLLIKEGFRRRRPPGIKEVLERKRVYYPFWVGYYRRRDRYDFQAIDAVSGDPAGIRMRRVFLNAFKNW